MYLPEGGLVRLGGVSQPLTYRWFNPKSGDYTGKDTLDNGSVATLESPDKNPWVLIAKKLK